VSHFLERWVDFKGHRSAQTVEFERLDELVQFSGIACFEVQVQVTQQQGFGRFNLVTHWRRVYRHSKANQVWHLLTNLNDLDTALSSYAKRFSIEPMFRDFKTGGYNLRTCRATGQRFLALVLLVAIAYTLTIEQGRRIRRKQIQHYVRRVTNRIECKNATVIFGLDCMGSYGSIQ
jgi:hypothetical protein